MKEVMWVCGMARCTRISRFMWKQDYSSLLPPAAVSSYVCGQLRRCDASRGGVPVVVESPSDAMGVFTFTASTADTAACALRDIVRMKRPLSRENCCLVLNRLNAVLRENSEVLALSDALSTGMCLRDARRSIKEAEIFVSTCERWLRTHGLATEDTDAKRAEEVLHSLGCNTNVGEGRDAALALCFTAANFPIQWGIETLAASLTRGNLAVWMPPLEAPLSALWLMHLLHRANQDVKSFPSEAVNIILCRTGCRNNHHHHHFTEELNSQQDENLAVVGLTNGFSEHNTHSIVRDLHPKQSEACSTGMPRVRDWHHRVNKPSVAILGLSDHCATTPAVRLKMADVAARICHHAFRCNGRMLQALHIVFVPQQEVLLVLRSVVQEVRQLRFGHSLDPNVDLGPLPGGAHLDAMKAAVDAAVCCSSLKIQQVCGGFEAAMPAGFFCLPCVLYGTLPVMAHADAEAALHAVCETTTVLRSELDRLGGGPFLLVCGYDPLRDGGALRLFFCDTKRYVVHFW